MDILIPLGKGSEWQNNELRYCLRSIEKFATGYDRIFIIGEDPGWLSRHSSLVTHHCQEVRANKEACIAAKIYRAFLQTEISDEAVLFNDDYVLLAPVDLSRLPYYHRGEIADAIPRQGCPLYRRALQDTLEALRAAGKGTLHFDVHFPMALRRAEFLGLKDWWRRSAENWQGFVVKSVYANNVLPGDAPRQLVTDLKFIQGSRAFDRWIAGRWVFSYSDRALKTGLKEWLAKKFPEPSQFESESGHSSLVTHHSSFAAA